MRRRIGVLRLTEPTKFTRYYECAAWHTTIEVPAGDYEITAEVQEEGGEVRARSYDHENLQAKLPGTVVSACGVSLWGGVPCGSKDPAEATLGKPDTYHWCGAGWALAHAILSGSKSNLVVLDPGFVARNHAYIDSLGTERLVPRLYYQPQP